MVDYMKSASDRFEQDEREHHEFIDEEFKKYTLNIVTPKPNTLHEKEILREFLITISQQFSDYWKSFVIDATLTTEYYRKKSLGIPDEHLLIDILENEFMCGDLKNTAVPIWRINIMIDQFTPLYESLLHSDTKTLCGVQLIREGQNIRLPSFVCFRYNDIRPQMFIDMYNNEWSYFDHPRMYCSRKFSVVDMTSDIIYPIKDHYVQIWKRDNPLMHTLDLT